MLIMARKFLSVCVADSFQNVSPVRRTHVFLFSITRVTRPHSRRCLHLAAPLSYPSWPSIDLDHIFFSLRISVISLCSRQLPGQVPDTTLAVWILFKNSARTAKKTPHFTVTKINWLTLFKEIIAVYSNNHTKPINSNKELEVGYIATTGL
jgi:hypothetical protein